MMPPPMPDDTATPQAILQAFESLRRVEALKLEQFCYKMLQEKQAIATITLMETEARSALDTNEQDNLKVILAWKLAWLKSELYRWEQFELTKGETEARQALDYAQWTSFCTLLTVQASNFLHCSGKLPFWQHVAWQLDWMQFQRDLDDNREILGRLQITKHCQWDRCALKHRQELQQKFPQQWCALKGRCTTLSTACK